MFLIFREKKIKSFKEFRVFQTLPFYSENNLYLKWPQTNSYRKTDILIALKIKMWGPHCGHCGFGIRNLALLSIL